MSERLTKRGFASRPGDPCSTASIACTDPVLGRLVQRGLDDELKGSAYAIVEGVDGRTFDPRRFASPREIFCDVNPHPSLFQ